MKVWQMRHILGASRFVKKRPFAATRQWRIFLHMSLQNVHNGLFHPHSEGTIGQLSGLSNQFLPFDRLCEYTRCTFQFNGATASEIDWAKWTTQRFYSPGRFQHFDKKKGIILFCLTKEIFTGIGRFFEGISLRLTTEGVRGWKYLIT